MGYDSHFSLSFEKKDKSCFTEQEQNNIIEEIKTVCGEEPNEVTNDQGSPQPPSLFLGFYDRHWYDWADDLKKVMLKFPEMSLHVTREGEDHEDTQKAYWKVGAKDWEECSDIVLERPVSDDDTVFIAVFEPMDSSISIIAVPADEDPEDYAEISNTCHWQKVDKMIFCGTKITL